MRVFIAACLLAGVIAVGAAAILDNFVQEPASVAFAEPGTRVLTLPWRRVESSLSSADTFLAGNGDVP